VLPHFFLYAKIVGNDAVGDLALRQILTFIAVAMATPVFGQAVLSPVPAVATTLAPPTEQTVVLKRDTPVELMATSEIRSDKAPPGTQFKLRLNRALIVDGATLVPIGATAFGEVTAAKASGGLGHTGAMSAKLLYISVDGVHIPLEGESSATGSKTGSVGVAVLLTGVAGLFNRGNNAKIKAGEIVSGFIAADTVFNSSSGPPRVISVTAPAVTTP
jgi:hypothetical protein